MKAQATFVRTDGRTVLNAIAAIDPNFASVVNSRNAEHDCALGFDQVVEQTVLGVFGMLLNVGPNTLEYLGRGLKELGLT